VVEHSADTSVQSASRERTVIGLFRTSGSADNARNRLKTEGFSEGRMMLKVLKEIAPAKTAIPDELATQSLNPFVDVLGDLLQPYVSYIRNGETVLVVRGLSNNDAEDVARILQFFDPLRVDVIPEREDLVDDLAADFGFEERRPKE
jgi:hypothetical protein